MLQLLTMQPCSGLHTYTATKHIMRKTIKNTR